MNTAERLLTMWLTLIPLLLIGIWIVYLARHNWWAMLGRVVFTAYWMFLTSLLLSPDPRALYHLAPLLPHGVPERGVHFSFFAVLAILACACRFRVRWYTWIIILIVYGLTVESLQYFVPPRQVEFLDYTENVLGVLAGCALWWIGRFVFCRKNRSVIARSEATKQSS